MDPNLTPTVKGEARYLYCVAESGERVSLGRIGLEGEEVYTIPYQDICAVAHDCPDKPYKSDDQERVKAWVLAHQKVVDASWQRWGVVLPTGFDTIVRGEEEADAGRSVRNWLKQDYESLKGKMERVRGKAEYGVQVFWDTRVIARAVAETSADMRRLKEEICSNPRGLAYMYRQRLEVLLKKELEDRADRCFKECYGRIRGHVDEIRVEKTKKMNSAARMILNLSCLVSGEGYTRLGDELDSLNGMEGLSVRFTGPWPPYSFVGA